MNKRIDIITPAGTRRGYAVCDEDTGALDYIILAGTQLTPDHMAARDMLIATSDTRLLEALAAAGYPTKNSQYLKKALSIPPALYMRISAAAAAHNRSVSGEICAALEAWLQNL